ncbi:MAG: hypothetical protein V3U87_05380 [Methylococcaceae bacterium]
MNSKCPNCGEININLPNDTALTSDKVSAGYKLHQMRTSTDPTANLISGGIFLASTVAKLTLSKPYRCSECGCEWRKWFKSDADASSIDSDKYFENNIPKKLRVLVSQQLVYNSNKIEYYSRFFEDLHINRSSFSTLVKAIEDEFRIKISDDEVEIINTFDGMVRYIESCPLIPQSTMAIISISRRHKVDAAGTAGIYKIFVNGIQVGSLKNNETITHEVTPGSHVVHFSWAFVKSNMLNIQINIGDCMSIVATEERDFIFGKFVLKHA